MEEALEREINHQLDEINAALDQRIQEQRAAIEKALADLKARMHTEQAEKEQIAASLERDLANLAALRNAAVSPS